MHQPFFETERRDVVVPVRVSQRLVDVEELDAFGRVIVGERLQTGDVDEKRRSRQTSENEHRVMILELPCGERHASFVKDFQVRDRCTDLGQSIGHRRFSRCRLLVLRPGYREPDDQSEDTC